MWKGIAPDHYTFIFQQRTDKKLSSEGSKWIVVYSEGTYEKYHLKLVFWKKYS